MTVACLVETKNVKNKFITEKKYTYVVESLGHCLKKLQVKSHDWERITMALLHRCSCVWCLELELKHRQFSSRSGRTVEMWYPPEAWPPHPVQVWGFLASWGRADPLPRREVNALNSATILPIGLMLRVRDDLESILWMKILSWETNSCSVIQEITSGLWKPRVYYSSVPCSQQPANPEALHNISSHVVFVAPNCWPRQNPKVVDHHS